MKRIFIILTVFIVIFSCENTKIGYLKTENAIYNPDSLIIRINPDPILDATRIKNNSPWVTLSIQGILGTDPINYELVDIYSTAGGNAEIMKEELVVRGKGVMQLPLDTKCPAGNYTVTLKVYNDSYSDILEDVFTFVLIE